LTAVGAVAILALGWFLLVSPQRSHAADLRTQAYSQRSANATLQSQVQQLEQEKLGLPAQQRILNQIATKIPDSPALPALIRQLVVAAKGAGVDLVSLAPGQPTLVTQTAAAATTLPASGTATSRTHAAPPSPLAQIPLTINVTGSYFNMESFFAAVEKLSRAMLVTQWTLTPASGSGGGSSGSSGSSGGSDTSSTLAPGTLNGALSASVFESPAAASAPTTPVVHAAPAK
jgi:Tfp pilus assembly protein PilO